MKNLGSIAVALKSYKVLFIKKKKKTVWLHSEWESDVWSHSQWASDVWSHSQWVRVCLKLNEQCFSYIMARWDDNDDSDIYSGHHRWWNVLCPGWFKYICMLSGQYISGRGLADDCCMNNKLWHFLPLSNNTKASGLFRYVIRPTQIMTLSALVKH